MCLRDGFDMVWIKVKGCKYVVMCCFVSGKKQYVVKCFLYNCGCFFLEEFMNLFNSEFK